MATDEKDLPQAAREMSKSERLAHAYELVDRVAEDYNMKGDSYRAGYLDAVLEPLGNAVNRVEEEEYGEDQRSS